MPDDGRWIELAQRATDARENMDSGRWTLGDIALEVKKDYGANSFGKFADEIDIHEKTLRDYRAVSAFYEKSARADIPAELSWSHARTAMRHGKHASDDPANQVQAALAFLEVCADNQWKATRAEVEAKNLRGEKVTPGKLFDAECGVEVEFTNHNEVTFHAPDVDFYDLLHEYDRRGVTVRVVIYPLDKSESEST